MKKASKIISIMLVTVIVASMFSGCGKKQESITGDNHLEYWLGNSIDQYGIQDYNEIESLQLIQEATGVTIEYIHPSSAAWEEQFNIMMASQDYTDLIQWDWASKYPGGFEGAVADGVVVELTDRLDKLPNYKSILMSNPDIDKTIRTADGKLIYFSSIMDDPIINANMGPMIRKDWLDKLNLDIPKTMDDWYNVLTAFKTQDPNGNGKADEIPFAAYKSPSFTYFASAYGAKKGEVYVKDGKVVYGSIQPEFKNYIIEMNKWYNEGLIDNEYPALDRATADANMTNDISGATIAYVGGGMGTYLKVREGDTEYDLVAAPWPSKDASSPAYIGTNQNRLTSGSGTVITTGCQNLDVAFKYMDYLYSDEAKVLQNWGVEGKSYAKNGDKYEFTDHIMNNPDGKSALQAIVQYADPVHGTPVKIMNADAYSQLQYSLPQQADAAVMWSSGDDSLMTVAWPMTSDEVADISEIKSSISAYENEFITKMIMGQEPISKFNEYVAGMKARGVDELEKIYQKAYDRYIAG